MGHDLHLCLAIAGLHNVKNALAAATCALAAGVDADAVVRGLKAFVPVKGRSRALMLQRDGQIQTLVDDTYNANPDSVRAAIDVLADLPGPRLLVLGDMGEVGADGARFHAEAGQYAQARGIDHVLTLGVLARHVADHCAGARHCATLDELNAVVRTTAASVSSILVKGSRFMRMERVIAALQDGVHNEKEAVHAH
jgi:UDP-N-acetylmuramoyl-tripeptide--D-alanyl-D-alanine ligase